MFGAWALLRPWGPWVAATGGTIAAIVIIPPSGLSALAWVGAVALGLWSIRAGVEALEEDEGARRRTRLLWTAGLLGGAALLYRPDLVVAMGARSGVVLWHLTGRDRRRLVLASLVGVSPYVVHLAMSGPGNVVRGMVIEPVVELRGGRALPLPPNPHDFDGFLQRAGTLDEPPWPFPAPAGPGPARHVAPRARGGRRPPARRRPTVRAGGRPRLLVMAAFAVGLFPQALQRADSTHLAWVSCVTLAFLPAAVVELWPASAPARRKTIAAIALPALCLLALVPHFTLRTYAEASGQTFGYRRNAMSMSYEGRTFRYARADAVDAVNALLPVVDELTEPGDRIFVGPGDLRLTPYSEAYLYFLLPELDPGDPLHRDGPGRRQRPRLRARRRARAARRRDPVLHPRRLERAERLACSTVPTRRTEVLADDFCLVESYGDGLFGRGLFEVYRRC